MRHNGFFLLELLCVLFLLLVVAAQGVRVVMPWYHSVMNLRNLAHRQSEALRAQILVRALFNRLPTQGVQIELVNHHAVVWNVHGKRYSVGYNQSRQCLDYCEQNGGSGPFKPGACSSLLHPIEHVRFTLDWVAQRLNGISYSFVYHGTHYTGYCAVGITPRADKENA